MKQKTIRLLLIEDNSSDVLLIREMLTEADELYEIDCAKRLSSGLERLSSKNFDVVLLDLGLPDSRGIETFEALEEEAKRIPIIIMTGLADRDMGLKTVMMGAQDYLVKGQITGELLAKSLRYGIERKRAEIALKETEVQLRNLITVAAHELRHPLTLFKSYTNILLESGGEIDSRDVRLALLGIEKAAGRMTRLVNQLLDTSRIESGQQQLNYEDVSCRSLSLGVTQEFRLIGHTDVEFMDKWGKDISVKADRESLRSVLYALVDNAVKFSPSGSRVDVWYEESGPDVIFHVADRGSGVPAEYRDSIFERFFQLEDVEHHSLPGMGVGLYIARNLVDMHDGRIWLESRENGGSLFSFSIPRLGWEQAAGDLETSLKEQDEEG